MLDLLLSEISSVPLLMRDSAIGDLQLFVHKLVKGERLEIKSQLPKLNMSGYIPADKEYSDNPYDYLEENSIAVIPILGNMCK